MMKKERRRLVITRMKLVLMNAVDDGAHDDDSDYDDDR